MNLRVFLLFCASFVVSSLAHSSISIEEAQRLVGTSFYAYYPRASCKTVQIYDKPTLLGVTAFFSTQPRRFEVKQLVKPDYDYYYLVQFDSGQKGYVHADLFNFSVNGSGNRKSLESLTEPDLTQDCYLKLSPYELEVRLSELRDAAAARVEQGKRRKAEEEARALEAKRQKEIEAAEGLKNRRENAASYLKQLPKDEFCELYGRAVRNESMYDIGDREDALTLVKSESRRRSLSFVDKLIKNEQFQIGNSECQLLAALGKPDVQNRTVGNWGVHIQHVYGRTYVYTKNGRVTSWQD